MLRHRAFGSGRFDLGNMVQAVWSTAQGDVLSVTDVHGEQISRLGAHFDPILAALAPLWWLWPSPEMLLVVQAFAVAARRPPGLPGSRGSTSATAFARPRSRSSYLAYAPVQWLTLSDFHPVALATPLLLFAWWHLDEERLWAFALLAGAAMATKEHVGLAVALMGVWYAVRHRRRREGLVIAVVAGAVALAAVSLVVPHFAVEGSSAFAGRYDSPSLDGRDLRYLSELLFPLLFLPLAAPLAALAAAPELGLNLALVDRHADVRSRATTPRWPSRPCSRRPSSERRGSAPRLAYPALAASAAGMLVLGPLGRVELRRRRARRRGAACARAGPGGRPGQRHQRRSAPTSRRASGSSASPCSARRPGWWSTSATSRSSTA